ncbi:MAG: GNAT family N-acetyltransferase [Candidatus Binatus sp.]|uniref:GNAT family N-acetyltransferase n=1 Tax=Candidatus Binatus sp. TaxID=2811406 RepID=UPI003BB22099
MSDITLRAPTDDDWPAILALAQLSLSELPNSPSQDEWLNNRRSFSPSDGIQRHFVAISDERIVGYACVEHRNKNIDGRETLDGVYRLFVVVAPSARHTLATRLLAKLRECLIDLAARRAWVVEYEADAGFLAYLKEMGFVKLKSFKLEDGNPMVEMTIDAPFQSLV